MGKIYCEFLLFTQHGCSLWVGWPISQLRQKSTWPIGGPGLARLRYNHTCRHRPGYFPDNIDRLGLGLLKPGLPSLLGTLAISTYMQAIVWKNRWGRNKHRNHWCIRGCGKPSESLPYVCPHSLILTLEIHANLNDPRIVIQPGSFLRVIIQFLLKIKRIVVSLDNASRYWARLEMPTEVHEAVVG